MAILSFTENHVCARGAERQGLPAWKRVAVGTIAGAMPILVSLAVVQAAPAIRAIETVLVDGLDAGQSANALATLLGLFTLTASLVLVGIASALWQRRQVERLGLFQASLVAPALVFVLVQVAGMMATSDEGIDGASGAQVLVTGMTPGGGNPVRITVYKRQPPNPFGCFVQGLRGRGC